MSIKNMYVSGNTHSLLQYPIMVLAVFPRIIWLFDGLVMHDDILKSYFRFI